MKHIKLHENHLFPEDLADINKLLKQLNPDLKKINWEHIKKVMKNATVFVIRDHSPRHKKSSPRGKVVGKTLLVHGQKFAGSYGTIHDVVVDEKYRGMGLGKMMTKEALKKAKKLGMQHVELTSNPMRIPANKLYQSLGFEKRDTNFYKYQIKK
jgi:ribosomal protein S18 acetylase RimI-like enzyme